MTIHPRTQATLAELRTADWFNNVGIQDTTAAIVLPGWDEAIASCESTEWENLLLEAANQYRERLARRSPSEFAKWNARVERLKTLTIPLVLDKTSGIVDANGLPQVFVDTVQWDILHVCMEAEYADVFPPGFYASQAFWYVRGHFPCGWSGRFPEGRLIIF